MALIDRIVKSQVVSVPNVYPGGQSEYPKVRPSEEIGVTGLLRTRGTGYVFEEWLPQLSVSRARQVYRQMRDNDAVLGALFFALEMLLRKADWFVEEGKGNSKAVGYARFLNDATDDMSNTWEDFIAECVNMFVFGFGLFEPVYKRRAGPKPPKGMAFSRFDDGLISWRKFAPRAAESILYWDWDDNGGLRGAVQLAPPNYCTVAIPIERLLLFRTTSMKNSPEGRSVLRNCFRPWMLKTRDEEIEGIGLERDMCGMPVLYVSAEALRAMGNGDEAAGMIYAKQMIRNIRVDEQMGAVLPQAFDDKGNRSVMLELLRTAGSKQVDADSIIRRHNADMLNTVLAGFIQLGQTEHGARSLHISASQIFAKAISAFMDGVAAVINRIAIPRMMDLNHMDLGLAPKLLPGEIGGRDLEELGNYVSKLAGAGLSFTDPDTAAILRKKADLPEHPSDNTSSTESGLDDVDPDTGEPKLRPHIEGEGQQGDIAMTQMNAAAPKRELPSGVMPLTRTSRGAR